MWTSRVQFNRWSDNFLSQTDVTKNKTEKRILSFQKEIQKSHGDFNVSIWLFQVLLALLLTTLSPRKVVIPLNFVTLTITL